ncbi:MAG: EamA family transporter [Solirubrobacterales bacterium]|nr:EamA family transporter [Solirubrobacterales bacterium]
MGVALPRRQAGVDDAADRWPDGRPGRPYPSRPHRLRARAVSTGGSVPPSAARIPGSGESLALGAACAIAAGVGFGTLGIFSRLFYDAGGDEFALLVLRFCGAFVVLAAIAIARARPRPTATDTGLSVALGLATLAATFCLLAGFKAASPGLVTLLFYVYPLIITVAAYFLFGEELTRWRVALLVVGTAGIALTVGIPDAATAAGIAWGLGAGACVSVYILGGRHVMSRSVDSFQFVALSFAGALAALVPLAAAVGVSWPPPGAVGHGIALIVVSTVLPTLLFYFAVRRIGAGGAARLSTVEAVTAVVLSYVVLGDAIVASQIAGGVLVVAAVVLLVTPGLAPRPWRGRRPRPASP